MPDKPIDQMTLDELYEVRQCAKDAYDKAAIEADRIVKPLRDAWLDLCRQVDVREIEERCKARMSKQGACQ